VRAARLLLATAVLVVFAAPAAAQELVDLPSAFLDALNALAENELAFEEDPAPVDVPDETGDLYSLDGGTPPPAPNFVDLVQESQFGLALTREGFRALFGDGGALDCASPEVSCPRYETVTAPFRDGAIVVGMQLAAEPQVAGQEVFTLALLANDDAFPTAPDPRPASPFVDTNKAWRLDLTAGGDTVAYLQVAAGGYQEFHTDARVLRQGALAWFVIPPSEFPLEATVVGFDAHTFFQGSEDEPGAADSVTGVNPRGTLPEPTTVLTPVVFLTVAEPEPSPSPSPAESPTASPTPRSTFDPGVGEVAEEDGTLIDWVLIAIGVIVVLVGGFLFFGSFPRTREREQPPPPTYGPTRERGKPPPPEEETPTPIGVTPPVEYAACDWAVYYRTDAGRRLLRPAKGPECCVYTVSVFLTVDEHELAARGRQEDVTPGAPYARLRMPHLVLEPHGLGAHVETGVRSGPAEDLAWMQGLGEPMLPEEVEPYRQLKSHEEPPEVAAHASWVVANVIKIDLESMCPGHINRYTGYASSRIAMNADVECTYDGPPECPVEFTAAGWVQGKAGIFIDYDLTHQLGSDPDELEPVAPEGTPFHGLTDLHDHERRDRLHYEASEVANDEANLQDDSLWLTFETGLVADAGTIVPQSIWPATGRVTALVGSTVEHGATIDAEMERVDCLAGPCCGYTACMCAPKLRLHFSGDFGVIEVDGTSYRITPAPGPIGAGRAWTLG
jgi:hypothetical protein